MSFLDFAIVIVVFEEADDGADAAGAEAVGRVADCEGRVSINGLGVFI